ncbi:hypothetical protein [Halobacterium wangiae]|uniref:hypothetical protein n=1 Tax=Halobacterium wangiae TaxID=2902623 RepID=UPI001E594AEA|nr:hypothetical protein [Halobacterium wangiae]
MFDRGNSRTETTDSDPTETNSYETERDSPASPSSWAPWGGRGLRSTLGYGSAPDGDELDEQEDDDSRWIEGLYDVLIVVGVVLFFFPEPATSMVGVFLILLGAGGWLVDALR